MPKLTFPIGDKETEFLDNLKVKLGFKYRSTALKYSFELMKKGVARAELLKSKVLQHSDGPVSDVSVLVNSLTEGEENMVAGNRMSGVDDLYHQFRKIEEEQGGYDITHFEIEL